MTAALKFNHRSCQVPISLKNDHIFNSILLKPIISPHRCGHYRKIRHAALWSDESLTLNKELLKFQHLRSRYQRVLHSDSAIKDFLNRKEIGKLLIKIG